MSALSRRALSIPIAGRAAALVLPLATGLLAAKNLGPSGRGLIALGVGLAIVVAPIAGMGQAHTLRALIYSRGPSLWALPIAMRQVRKAVVVSLPLATAAVIVAFVVISAQQLLSRSFLAATFVLVSVSAGHQLLSSTLIALGVSWRAIWGEIIPWVVALCIFSASSMMNFASAAVYMVGVSLGYVVGFAFMAFPYWSPIASSEGMRQRPGSQEERVNAKMVRGAAWSFDVLDVGATRSDRLYATLVMPVGDAGVYAIASTFTVIWRFIPATVGLLGPTKARMRLPKSLGPILSHPIGLTSVVTGILLLVTAWLGPSIAVAILGDDYAAVAAPMRILCIAEALLSVYTLLALSMVGSRAMKLSFLPPLVGAVALPLLMVVLYSTFGIAGSAIATLVAFALMAAGALVLRLQAARRGLL